MAQPVSGVSIGDLMPGTPDADESPAGPSDMLRCEKCGAALDWTPGTRGRKPRYCPEHRRQGGGTNTRSTRRAGNVDEAVAVLGNAYDMLALGLMAVSPSAASTLAHRVDELQVTNRRALESDPKLCATITRAGATSGRATFILANAAVLVPVAGIAAKDIAARRAPKAPKAPPAQSNGAGPAAHRPDLSFFG